MFRACASSSAIVCSAARDDVGLRGVHDHDAAAGRGLDVDVVQADPGARDHRRCSAASSTSAVTWVCDADDQRFVRPDLGRTRSPGRELRTHVDLEVPPEQVEALLGELLGDEDAHGWLALRLQEDALGRRDGRAALHG